MRERASNRFPQEQEIATPLPGWIVVFSVMVQLPKLLNKSLTSRGSLHRIQVLTLLGREVQNE